MPAVLASSAKYGGSMRGGYSGRSPHEKSPATMLRKAYHPAFFASRSAAEPTHSAAAPTVFSHNPYAAYESLNVETPIGSDERTKNDITPSHSGCPTNGSVSPISSIVPNASEKNSSHSTCSQLQKEQCSSNAGNTKDKNTVPPPSCITYHPPVHFHNIDSTVKQKSPPLCVVSSVVIPAFPATSVGLAPPEEHQSNTAEKLSSKKSSTAQESNATATEKGKSGMEAFYYRTKEFYPSSFTPALPTHSQEALPSAKSSSSRNSATDRGKDLLFHSTGATENAPIGSGMNGRKIQPSSCASRENGNGREDHGAGSSTEKLVSAADSSAHGGTRAKVNSTTFPAKCGEEAALLRDNVPPSRENSSSSTISSASTISANSGSGTSSFPSSLNPHKNRGDFTPQRAHSSPAPPSSSNKKLDSAKTSPSTIRTSASFQSGNDEDNVMGITATNTPNTSLSSSMDTPFTHCHNIPNSTVSTVSLSLRKTGGKAFLKKNKSQLHPSQKGEKKANTSSPTFPSSVRRPFANKNSSDSRAQHHYASVNFRFGSAWFIAPFRCDVGEIVVVEYPLNQTFHMGIISGITTTKPSTFYSDTNKDPDLLTENEIEVLPRLLRRALPSDKEAKLALRENDLWSLENAQALATEKGVPVIFQDAEWLLDGSALTLLVYVYGDDVSQVNELADELASREAAEIVFTYPSVSTESTYA